MTSVIPSPLYCGRFAPSPTGPLHFGSLVAALGSYADARSHGGRWLVRMEDVDRPRTVAGAADDILRTLEMLGFEWDGEVLYQSWRDEVYQAALEELARAGAVYPCACTRKEIADSSIVGVDGPVYAGACRSGLPAGRSGRSLRVRVEGTAAIEFDDRAQGRQRQDVAGEVGDFVVRRADGLFAYQLAVVVDDAAQQVTHVVRGADLLDSTPRQIYLQRLLGVAEPSYLHLPVAVNAAGEKLSKQTLAPAVAREEASAVLYRALRFLEQSPPGELRQEQPPGMLAWAVANWQPGRLRGIKQRPVSGFEQL